jgi:hypothetical protein
MSNCTYDSYHNIIQENFNNYFCKSRKSKLHFRDRVAVLNVFLYQTGGSNGILYIYIYDTAWWTKLQLLHETALTTRMEWNKPLCFDVIGWGIDARPEATNSN